MLGVPSDDSFEPSDLTFEFLDAFTQFVFGFSDVAGTKVVKVPADVAGNGECDEVVRTGSGRNVVMYPLCCDVDVRVGCDGGDHVCASRGFQTFVM